jgi:hypothetical protein
MDVELVRHLLELGDINWVERSSSLHAHKDRQKWVDIELDDCGTVTRVQVRDTGRSYPPTESRLLKALYDAGHWDSGG